MPPGMEKEGEEEGEGMKSKGLCIIYSKILQHKSKREHYVLANQNADFKLRLELVLDHAHESSLWSI